MLRETTSAANDAARLDAIETADLDCPGADFGAELRGPSLEIRAAAAVRSRRIPGLDAVLEAWSRLPPATQDQLGVQAVAVAFYGWLAGDALSPTDERWLTDAAASKSSVRSDKALNLLAQIAERSMPELYGTKKRDPAWARLDADTAALDAVWEAALPSPVHFAIALHRRTWQALQASAAFLRAAGKAEEREDVTWPAEDAEDEALTDLLMLSCRDRADAEAIRAHLTWYLGVRPQHPKRPALSEAEGSFIAVRLRDLGMVLGAEGAGAAPVPEPGAMLGLILAHRAAWSLYSATPHAEETGWDAHFALTDVAGAGSEAVLLAPCADQAEAIVFIEHAHWYAAELEAVGEAVADCFGYESRQMLARAGDLVAYLGDSAVAGVPAERT
ncbi:hypothetical protein [Methylobacterium symbioticum]|uniref:Uncharacterized protein n=1 Tax=Methylobacterium symbioticum TaxID=2584084 RepID=A0A509E931_9HYPH|nr:hypothetical protein [Methylobacterium symbioticum]VUD70652.1 hypothetical protein MET9862_01224 [Methylobacterium symbioticum]